MYRRGPGLVKAGGSGFEPEQAEPKSAVLPLHHPPVNLGEDVALYSASGRGVNGNWFRLESP